MTWEEKEEEKARELEREKLREGWEMGCGIGGVGSWGVKLGKAKRQNTKTSAEIMGGGGGGTNISLAEIPGKLFR